MGVDYYKTLHVERNTEDDDVKKAHHRLAIRWHPDKNPNNVKEAEANFKEISRAYDVLNDPRKRALYEQLAEAGVDGNTAPPGPPPPLTPVPSSARSGGGGAEEVFGFSNPLRRESNNCRRDFDD